MASWVDISTLTDACTHSKQGVGTQMSWLGHKHSAIQEYPCFPINMHRGLRWYWESGGHAYTYWCIYTFYPRCGNRSGVIQVGPPYRAGITIWRWDLHSELGPQLEVRPPIRGETSNRRWDLQSEVGPPIGGETSNQRWDLQSEVDLWLEV